MRERALLAGDIRFQFRYGFYYLYLIDPLSHVGARAAQARRA